ncbi:MAG: hypothetical protein MJK04_17355 [Psychrosphaera sp.]|nr:hypothetical protein [Psychrosphaera sp.]
MKHGNLKVAQQYFEKAIVKYSDAAVLYQGLGKVYVAKGKVKLARESFVKAVAVAKIGSNPKLAEFEADLAGLKL